jgi:hypothetical protein
MVFDAGDGSWGWWEDCDITHGSVLSLLGFHRQMHALTYLVMLSNMWGWGGGDLERIIFVLQGGSDKGHVPVIGNGRGSCSTNKQSCNII